ncbi:DnaA regulatory inactivator Hda [Propionivibrio sp.]|nr:DnaA regulatory inactivator Hda [Propionivibrio sp.]MBK7355146.1 DnaA regulatory inactivator Hda [Propionivibrio sp.]MBK8399537.1 DnaA regulatory inactivator Hda [Propionivibrio sp.]MBK8745338.1 DnaA regulatory inactivator Hda [Propionivibrio sp.]MBK8893303.1 DnaA regulatory inactivator Hda [Propionivibrio sp.]MBL0208506.1 DnaA regulatory inactivator Hda [Propionivibrio sp.]
MRQLILDLLPETQPRLDNFVAGGNCEALTGLAAWFSPDSSETSLFLWGESSSGKTHLLRACEAYYSDAASTPDLSNIAHGLDAGQDDTRSIYAVDNVQALNEAGQIILFNLFNRLAASGRRLITAASQPPLKLALREDLRTRLGSGLIYRLQVLSDDEKIAALSAQASARGLCLPPEAFGYLLARAPRDMSSLMAYLVALDRYSLENKRTITLALMRELLAHRKSP